MIRPVAAPALLALALTFDPCGDSATSGPELVVDPLNIAVECTSYGFFVDATVQGWMAADPRPVISIYGSLERCDPDRPETCVVERHPVGYTLRYQDPYTESFELDLGTIPPSGDYDPGYTTTFLCSDAARLTWSLCAVDYFARVGEACGYWGADPDFWRGYDEGGGGL